MLKKYKIYKVIKDGTNICLNPTESFTMSEAESKVFLLQKQFPGVKFEVKENTKKVLHG